MRFLRPCVPFAAVDHACHSYHRCYQLLLIESVKNRSPKDQLLPSTQLPSTSLFCSASNRDTNVRSIFSHPHLCVVFIT